MIDLLELEMCSVNIRIIGPELCQSPIDLLVKAPLTKREKEEINHFFTQNCKIIICLGQRAVIFLNVQSLQR